MLDNIHLHDRQTHVRISKVPDYGEAYGDGLENLELFLVCETRSCQVEVGFVAMP